MRSHFRQRILSLIKPVDRRTDSSGSAQALFLAPDTYYDESECCSLRDSTNIELMLRLR